MADFKGITKQGEVVDKDAPGVAYVVDMDDQPSAKLLIESVKIRFAKDNPDTVAHLAVNGVAVPIVAGEAETPEEKLLRLEGEGALSRERVIATTKGFKTESEMGESGLGVTDAGSVHLDDKSVHLGGADPILPGEGHQGPPPVDPPSAHTLEELALIAGLGEPLAQKLFDAGLRSRAEIAGESDTDLGAVPGVGVASIEKIRAFLSA